MIALCAILLLAPDTRGEVKVTKRTYTISGSVGLAGVTMRGFPGSTTVLTDDNGVYTAVVDHGWSGSVQPVKAGYTFDPPAKPYSKVTANMTDENYTPTALTYKISGAIQPAQAGVKMVGFLEEVITDAGGRYTATVPWGWSGKIVPEKPAWRFDPANKPYNQVTRDMKDENYKASEQMFVISGSAGVAGVVMKGLPGDPKTGPGGAYRVEVKYNWAAKVTPTLEGYEFNPPERDYPPVTENLPNETYTAKIFTFQIAGTAGMTGVQMKGLPGEPITDGNGYYVATVNYGWTGTVTPFRPGFTFAPASKSYPKVTVPQENQDYNATAIQLTIAGNTTTGGVILSGLPGDPMSDPKGQYAAKVDYNWEGTVTPKKDGYLFEPPSITYPALSQDRLKQDYKSRVIRFKIAGNTSVPGVTLKGFPGLVPVVSGADGSYSVEVDYGWTGKIVPQKPGYSFDPNVKEYPGLLAPQPKDDYLARITQYALSGRVVDERGNGVPEVSVAGDGLTSGATTDADGRFELKVDHGWKGKVTFTKEGYTFTALKPFEPVLGPVAPLTVSARLKMVTITDRVAAGTEPLAEVKVTATPGNYTAMTDLKGIYKIQVPHGWTGELTFEKPGFDFQGSEAYTVVTEDIDKISPTPKPAVVPLAPTTAPPATAAPPATTAPPAPVPSNEQALRLQLDALSAEQRTLIAQNEADRKRGVQPSATTLQRISEIQSQIHDLMNQLNKLPGAAVAPEDLTVKRPGETLPTPTTRAGPAPVVPPIVEGRPTLRNVLRELGDKTGVSITWDPTVKDDPVDLPLERLGGLPVTSALQMIVSSIKPPYAWRPAGTANAYFVYRPISNQFPGTDLIQALADISAAAQVSIVTDPNVTGTVNVSFDNASLDDALQMVLAGKPYVVKKEANYYLVADRGLYGRAFMDISESRRLRMNYTTAARAKALLSPVFSQYVQAEPINPLDPNDQGHTLTITAPLSVIDRITRDLHEIDREKRQVLLEARVVVMERGDLLNLGTEWGWPTLKAGLFRDGAGTSASAPIAGWPWGLQLGYTPDRTFTDSLMMTLNLLQENSQADIIANPTVVAQDGHRARMGVIQEEWFMMAQSNVESLYARAELQKIESGTVLTITPRIGDNNDITLEMAVEVSDSIPKARGSELPLVTRRTAQNSVTVKDGGTVAVAGLTENRSKSSEKRVPGLSSIPLLGELFKNRNRDKESREIAVFVTANLVRENAQAAALPSGPRGLAAAGQPAPDEDQMQQRIREILANPNR